MNTNKRQLKRKTLILIWMLVISMVTPLLPVQQTTVQAASSMVWQPVGNAGFSAGSAEYTSIALDSSGTPYVVYRDFGNSSKATVMKYNGINKSWEPLGTAGFSAGEASFTSIALDSSGTPYVVYGDGGNSNKATVMKYNGINKSWETVGDAGFSAGGASYTSIALDSKKGTPYVVYKDWGNSYKATVMKYNEINNSWETVGTAGFSAGETYDTSIALDSSGSPYVVYQDNGNSNKATVMKYNGINKSWETVGSAGFSAGVASYTSIALDSSGTPYVVYRDSRNSSKATVMKYNESSWEPVGTASFSAGEVFYTSIALDSSGSPYVVSQDRGNYSNKATVMKYNGINNSWETVGTAGFSASVASYTSIALDSSGTPYVVYQDGGNSKKATVMKLSPNPAKAIIGFGFNGLTPAVTGTVDEAAKTVALTVPYGTNVTALVPTITHTGASVSPNSYVAQDFTNPVTYTVIAADLSTQEYEVTVTVAARNAPSAPVIQSAIGGDAHATITWNPVTTAAGYNVYMSTTPGAYGTTALESVVSTVYSYTALDLTNGTTYYFIIRARNADGESPDSNEVSATPQVLAPGMPNLLTAESGNAAITLTWAPVSGSTGYNIYQRLGSDTYGAEVATVTGSVYSHEVTGLTNGTMYNFTIKAINPGGVSDPSNEVSATPMTVPSAPTEVRAVSGNGQGTITFTAPDDQGGSPITGYEVTVLPDHRTVTGQSSPITITGLTNGRAYTFVVRTINSVGLSTASVESNAVTPYSPSSSNNNGASPQTPSAPARSTTEGIEVLINGKPEQAGIAATTEKNGRTIRTITLDPKKLGDRLQAEGSRSVITIPFSTPSDVMIGVLNGQMIKDMEAKQQTIEIRTEKATYTLPALQINIDAISERIGREVDLEQIQIEIEISEPTEEQLMVVENAVNQGEYTLVVPPLNFSVRGSYGDVTVDVSKFNAYVKRTFAIPDGVDPNKITTGVVIDPDGTVRHVPTKIELIDGKYYATINSLTNSTYALISNPVAFKDVAGYWAEEAVNEMGSRLVVSGVGNDLYNPDQAITRAEFAAIMVRAMGLKENRGATPFSDVRSSDWYSGAVRTALDYELINGYEDGTFRPQQQITREQAMVVIARAMEVTGLKSQLPAQDSNKIPQSYDDAMQVSGWARDSVADVLQAGIISGRSSSQLAPEAFITRAEVALIIQRLLQQSELI